MKVSPPRSEAELLERARAIAGLSMAELAARLDAPIPAQARRAKGWAGQLVETALGATAGSRPEPDFQRLGIELKTIPVRPDGRPLESTYVCTVPLEAAEVGHWEAAYIRHKLARVLWVPLVGEAGGHPAERRIGAALLWSPDPAEDAVLRADWEELMEQVCLGRVDTLTARHGTALQIRPKAADSHARRRGVGASGAPEAMLPRGFYLRAGFTATLLARRYALGGGQ
ncbi:MAG: DNA mismatch repair endonuclease MutH [Ectothiorhodospiraceae bacterium]|nr:DNA mismatch repair endonuclease MutH [Ectothiorhodospiraceae bacterium]